MFCQLEGVLRISVQEHCLTVYTHILKKKSKINNCLPQVYKSATLSIESLVCVFDQQNTVMSTSKVQLWSLPLVNYSTWIHILVFGVLEACTPCFSIFRALCAVGAICDGCFIFQLANSL